MAAPSARMLTANRLKDGAVLYWKAGAWVEAFEDADKFADAAQAEAALSDAQRFVAANAVVNPYLFDVRVEADDVHPVKEREIIRAAGPSVLRAPARETSERGNPKPERSEYEI